MNCFRLLAAALLVCVSGAQCNAQSARTPGVSASEIKFGQTLPLSGPVSAYATFGRTTLAYFAMINERGGINGRNPARYCNPDSREHSNDQSHSRHRAHLVEKIPGAAPFTRRG